MICENDYCIYWENNTCILDEIELDNVGMCASCIRVSIPEEILNDLREKQLKELENIVGDDF